MTSSAQYFNFLHDNDSTTEGYIGVVQCNDGSFLTLGSRLNSTLNRQEQIWLNISPGGGIVQNKKLLSYQEKGYHNNYPNLKKRPNGGYVFPLAGQYWSSNFDKYYHFAGIALLDEQFDTIAVKEYTDTSLYCDIVADCTILPDGGFLLAGYRTSPNISQSVPLKALLIRTDSLGNLIWMNTYQEIPGKDHIAGTLQSLSGNRTLVGASVRSNATISQNDYYKHRPWFFIIDNTSGLVLRDTLYDSTYALGGMCYSDINGGYYHWGAKDSLYTNEPEDPENFPRYLSRLDTNFNIIWLANLSYFEKLSSRTPWSVKQLQNGDYLMVGNAFPASYIPFGWAARINSAGTVVWDKYYVSDSANHGYLADAVERQDGSIVMVGWATNDSLPQWHGQDAWIIGIDANGDLLPHSAFTANIHSRDIGIAVYPNPNTGTFTIEVPEQGKAEIYDILGRFISSHSAAKGKTMINLKDVPSGTYLLRFTGSESGLMAGKRLAVE